MKAAVRRAAWWPGKAWAVGFVVGVALGQGGTVVVLHRAREVQPALVDASLPVMAEGAQGALVVVCMVLEATFAWRLVRELRRAVKGRAAVAP